MPVQAGPIRTPIPEGTSTGRCSPFPRAPAGSARTGAGVRLPPAPKGRGVPGGAAPGAGQGGRGARGGPHPLPWALLPAGPACYI